jgi:undecaprenyl diphosphate synthase
MTDERRIEDKEKNCVPQHVAIIMDGNGRWAKKRGLPRLKGHEQGSESVRAVLRACRKVGVKYLTLYAFSVENWIRPKSEIRGLMTLLIRFLRSEEHELHDNKVRLRLIGQIDDLPREVQKEAFRVMKATEHYESGQLILALSYGGRTEIADAVMKIARRVKSREIDPEKVDEKMIGQYLYAPDIPDPDLLIRTSGEMRVSNFLLWQISYSEFYFTNVLWPDFREKQFVEAIEEYGRRHRRFGDIE